MTDAKRDEHASDRRAETIDYLRRALESAERGYWTQCRERAELAAKPCQSEPDRMLELFPFDILTKGKDGTFTKHNGLCMFGIQVPDGDLEEVFAPVRLVVGL